jgi:hypothetical protein
MQQLTSRKRGARRLCNGIFAATVLVTVPFVRAEASTLATFGWVDASGSTGSGTLAISLPGTVTSPQFGSSRRSHRYQCRLPCRCCSRASV